MAYLADRPCARRSSRKLFRVAAEPVKFRQRLAQVRRNKSAFTGWSRTFTDPRLCAAIVDRLTFNASIIETGTESYRLARSQAQKNKAAG
ncbi:ATP-binding protein [Streptomyces mirabilis]